MQQKASGYAERSAATPADQRPHSDASFVVESASPASVCSATGDAAPAEETVRTVRMLHPWLAMTEEAYYYYICIYIYIYYMYIHIYIYIYICILCMYHFAESFQ